MSNEIVKRDTNTLERPGIGNELTVDAMVNRKKKIAQVLHEVMEEGVHYGRIPGCGPKPSLFKSGAEILATTFGLAPTFAVVQADLGDGHREYRITCTLNHIASGAVLGEGVGICSTMETKYRYRSGKPNPNIADTYNTVLKMAKKRAQVDCTLTAVGASDLLAQDLEDLVREDEERREREQEQPRQPSANAAKLEDLVKRMNAAESDEDLAKLIPELAKLDASVKEPARAVYRTRQDKIRADEDAKAPPPVKADGNQQQEASMGASG